MDYLRCPQSTNVVMAKSPKENAIEDEASRFLQPKVSIYHHTVVQKAAAGVWTLALRTPDMGFQHAR